MDRSRSRTRMPVYRKPMAPPRFADRRYSHQLSPAAARVRAVQSGAFPDEEVKQVSFPALVDDRVSGLVRPPDHLDRRGRIVRHKVDDLPDLNLGQQLVQLHENRGALDPDLEHLVIGEGGKTADAQGSDLFREELACRGKRKERGPVARQVRGPQPRDPSVAIEPLDHRSGLCQDRLIDLLQNPTEWCADRAEVRAALEETDCGPSRQRDPGRLCGDFGNPPRNRCIDARDADESLPRIRRTSPDESLRIIEEVIREFAAIDLHAGPLDQEDVGEEQLRIRIRSNEDAVFVRDPCGAHGGEFLSVYVDRTTADEMEVRASMGFEGVREAPALLEKRGQYRRVRQDRKGPFVVDRDERQEAVRALLLLHGLLFHGRLEPWGGRRVPHLDEAHRGIFAIVDLRMPHPATDRRVLDPAFLQDAALAVLIRMTEFPTRAVGDHLDLAVGMQGPNGSGRQRVVVEDPQRAEPHPLGIVVTIEREMPAAMTGAAVDWHVDLVDGPGIADCNHEDVSNAPADFEGLQTDHDRTKHRNHFLFAGPVRSVSATTHVAYAS